MADFLENILRAMKLVPERVDSGRAVADLDESLQAPPQMDRYLQGFQQGLLGNKADYDQAQKVFINPNSTDEQRQSAQLAMNQAHDRANYTRDLAKRMGYNLDNYGANTSLDDATKNYQADTQGAIRQLLNQDMTSEQYYDEAYRRLHEAGLPMRQAQQEAARRANLYKAQRLAKYNTAMQMYGQNSDGTLNDLAVQMLGNTMSDFPELAELYYKTYANPKEQYNNNFSAAQNQKARDDALKSALAQIQQNYLNGFGVRENQAYWHNWLAGQDLPRAIQKIEKTGEVNLSNSKELNQQQFEFNKALKDIDYQQRKALQQNQYENSTSLELLKASLKVQSGGETDNVLKDLETYDERLSSNYNDLSKVLKDLNESLNPDEARIADINRQLKEIEDSRSKVRKAMLNGGRTPDDVNNDSYPITGNWNNDGPVVTQLNDWLYSNGYRGGKDDGVELRQRIIVDYLVENGYPKEKAKEAVGAKW